MNKNVAKQEILKAALHSFYLDGIRATKVDDIAASLSISKRTLYELYPSKSDLIQACVQKMQKECIEKIKFLEISPQHDALTHLWEFINIYINNLYQTQITFWTDLIQNEDLKEWCNITRQEWAQRLLHLTENCQQEGFFLKKINTTLFSDYLLTGIFRSRIDNRPFEKQYVYSYIMVRGVCTPTGLGHLNKIIDQNDGEQKEYLLFCR